MSLRVLAIFCLILVQQSLCDDNQEQVRDGGQTSSDPFILDLLAHTEHELVEIEVDEPLQKRSIHDGKKAGKRIRIRAFGENIELWLHPKDAVLVTDDTPVYYSNRDAGAPGHVKIGTDFGILRLVGQILEDPHHLASLVIGIDKLGRITLNGQIGAKHLAIVSLSDPIGQMAQQDTYSDLPFVTQKYHAVYKTQRNVEENMPDVRDLNETRTEVPPHSGVYPRGLYPEVLVVVDWSIFKRQKHNLIRFLEYILAFVNGIDLKYRVLKNPRVRLRIAGILVCESTKGLPYMSRNKISRGVVDYENAMDSSATFFYQIRESVPLESYDVAITITKLLFGIGEDATVRGSSFEGSVCKNESTKMMFASAVIRDNGAFSGVYTAAHELGHVLGMIHDTPDNDNCEYREGYIMAEFPIFNINSVYFSKCSLQDIQKRLDSGQLECLYNVPETHGRRLPHLMPGRFSNALKQCSLYGYENACGFNTHRFCLHLHCLAPNGTCIHLTESSLEGTLCSATGRHPRRFCVHGRCVQVPTA